MEPLGSYLVLSAILFAIGIYGLVSKRNALRLIFAVELIINAALINLVAFSRYNNLATGQTFALFGISVAAAEAAVGLAIIIVAFRIQGDIDVSELRRLRG